MLNTFPGTTWGLESRTKNNLEDFWLWTYQYFLQYNIQKTNF